MLLKSELIKLSKSLALNPFVIPWVSFAKNRELAHNTLDEAHVAAEFIAYELQDY